MLKSEIEQYVKAGRSHSGCVDRSLSPDFPGFVRTVTLREGNKVSIVYEAYGTDEGGAYFWAAFPTLDEAITYLESFLGSGLSNWINYSKTGDYPERDFAADPSEGTRLLADAIAKNSPVLPTRYFELRGNYWAKFRNAQE